MIKKLGRSLSFFNSRIKNNSLQGLGESLKENSVLLNELKMMSEAQHKEILKVLKSISNFENLLKQKSMGGKYALASFAEETQIAKDIWERHEDETYRKDQSHIRGVGRWADDARWIEIGTTTLQVLNRYLNAINRGKFWEKTRVILEWGPGGGSNIYALGKYSRLYYGVDISDKNLMEAKKVSIESKCSGFCPIFLTDSIEDAMKKVENDVDVFISTAVFQHFPSKAYGVNVLNVVFAKMAPGAVGFVQIRFENGNEKFRPIEELSEYKRRHIFANNYRIDEFASVLEATGFVGVSVTEIRPEFNYVHFCFQKPESAGN